MPDKCKGLAGRLFGHSFRPVYDTTAPNGVKLSMSACPADVYVRALEALCDRVYKGHVCTRCGHWIIKEQ